MSISEKTLKYRWRGKNIQWLKFKPTKQICSVGGVDDSGVYYVEGMFVKYSTWHFILENYEWSEDNKTWRKFE